jgi:DNA-binding IclR family transcriptional regulator
MSFHLTNLTWDLDPANCDLSPHGLLVLLRLAHLGVQSTGACWATVPELAVACRMSDSGVRRQLKLLEASSLITQFREGRRTSFRVNVAPRND